MLIAKNDEKERSHIFRIVIWTASIIIIVVAAYFLIRSFGANPIRGTWKYQDDNIVMDIKKSDKLTITFANLQDVTELEVTMEYDIDKSDKMIVIKSPTETELRKIAEETGGKVEETVLDTAVGKFTTSFDYSIESQKLTLTDREYGDQMVFDKQ